MRFTCGERKARREAQLQAEITRVTEWHPWFAWLPVRVTSSDCRWLEWVERKVELYERLGSLPPLIKREQFRSIS